MNCTEKIDHPNTEPIGKRLYRLEEDYELKFDYKGLEFRMLVKAGFEYDGASVPQWAWTISGIRPDGLNRAASLIHDIIYVYKGILDDTCKYVEVYYGNERVHLHLNRKDADLIFRDILKCSGVTKWRRNLSYVAVRTGGNKFWKIPRTHE